MGIPAMTNLTEQWKKGKLDHGWYYIKYHGAYKTDQWKGYYWENSWSENVEEVIAPVPSYDDWVYLHKARNDAHEIAESLTQENKQLRKWCEEFNALDVAKENKQLKEMLYKCREKLDRLDYGCEVWQGDLTDFIEEIDNAIGGK